MKDSLISIAFVLIVSFPAYSQTNNSNCVCCSKDHTLFDFWIGDWTVYTTGTDNIAGYNTIERIEGGCALRETYKSTGSPFTGTSYNYFDTGTGLWNQLWLDNAGQILKLSGEFDDNKMTLASSPTKNPSNGNIVVDKITWTDNGDGTVRQFWERKVDDGEWQVAFDGTYVKKEEK